MEYYETKIEYLEGELEKHQPRVGTSDLISRAEARTTLQRYYYSLPKPTEDYDKGHLYGVGTAINILDIEVPSVSAEPKRGEWIPVDERLPEDGQGVLVTVDANKWNIEVGSCIYSGGTFHSKLYDLDVIAWQPLPTPYKIGVSE